MNSHAQDNIIVPPEFTKVAVVDLSDEDLVKRCKEELPTVTEAYLEILRRYESLIYNTTLKMLGNRQEAEEATQDTFLQVFHKLYQFEGRSAFKTWLFRIAYNFCLARRAKLAKRREREGEFAENESRVLDDITSHMIEADLSDKVQEAIAKLKGEQKRIIILKFISGLTLNEISDVLDIKLSATKMRLYRALEALKEVYTESDDTNESPPQKPKENI